MILQLVGAFLAALLFSLVFGRRFLSWLEKNNYRQPIKDVVEKKIYAGSEEDNSEEK